MKRGCPFDENTRNKKAHVEISVNQQLAEALSRIEALEKQLQLERQVATRALHEQEKAFSDWQRSVEQMYYGTRSNILRITY